MAGRMRRRLRIQVIFEPARLSADHLRSAYERIVPVARRDVPTRGEVAAYEQQPHGRTRAQRQGRVA